MHKSLAIVGTSALLFASLVGVASAQATQTTQTTVTRTQDGDVVGPHNPYCGAWVNGEFQTNGNCVTETTTTTTATSAMPAATSAMPMDSAAAVAPRRFAERISGQITSVNGHLITLQHGDRTLVVDDSRALERELTGHVATGRTIVAHGYWEDDTFYANRFD